MSYIAELTARLLAGVSLLSGERRESLKRYFLSALMPDGSFRGRGQTGDLYYTSFALRGLFLLGGIDNLLLQKITAYIENVKQRQLNAADLTSLLMSESIVHLLRNTVFTDEDIDCYAVRWAAYRQADGCFASSVNSAYSSTYATFLAAASFELLGRSDLCGAIPLETIMRRQQNGGFTELPPLRESGTNPTAAAVALFRIRQESHYDYAAARTFLQQRQLLSGGFQAHRRIPAADLLSTFSATAALNDIAVLDSGGNKTDDMNVRHFVNALRCPDGGYYAYTGDTRSDVEYTFYGMALEN
ncbi:MAG: hypothetical protein LBT89_03980 [Planctomycetaceae bacterium]|jgi:geranylgeranyl transferase type-2 subunit beta|nr:hypothetical protein [Planctomycetaceae bacterium]